MSAPRHIVFGAGAIGSTLAAVLTLRGETVRMVSRSGAAFQVPDGVEVVAGDARDPAFTTEVARGASVLYQVLNPPYHRWLEEFPALQRGVLAAAEANGARLVSMENVYMYGRPGERPLTEDRTYEAHTRKGQLRARMAEELQAAQDAGRVEVAVGRASDYFGPGGGQQSVLGDRLVPKLLAGKPASVLGDPDQPHTYTYIPDIAEALAILGERPEAVGRVFHLPNDPRTRTTRELAAIVSGLGGSERTRLRPTPTWLLRVVGRFNPTVRELVEMAYEFEEPFVVDSSAITRELGLSATPVEEALEATVASYR